MSVLRIMLFMLASKITNQIQYFKSRVSADLGLFEAENCLEAQLNTFNNQNLLDSASLIVTPNAYKTNKLYSVVPFDASGDMTFTRATSATRVNAQGVIETVGLNIPRIDYSDSSCPSILVEPQRTNLLTRSEEFENGTWNKTRCTVLHNVATAPNGTSTADYVIGDNTTGLRYIGLVGISTTIGTTWTFSFFCKKVDRSVIGIQINEGGAQFPTARFNFDTNTFIQLPANMNCSFVLYANGWYRLIFTRTPTNGTSSTFGIFPTDLNGNLNGVGDGISKTLLWGAQLEEGANATSYIPTTTAAVTRNADVITKTSATALIGQTEGTIFIDYNKVLSTDAPRNIISLNDGTNDNLIELCDGVGSGNLGRLIYTCTTNSVFKSTGFGQNTTSPSGRYKICLTYLFTSTNMNFNFFVNGVKVRTDNYTFTAFNRPLSRVNVGNRNGAFIGLGGHNVDFISKTQITDAQAIQLTTL